MGFPCWLRGKESACQCRRHGFDPWVWRRRWQPTPVFLPGEPQERGSLVGCRLWGRTESDTTEATWRRRRRVLAVVNSAAVNTGVNVSFLVIVLSEYVPRSRIPGSYGNSVLVFRGTSVPFSMVAAPTYIPTYSVADFPFLHTLTSPLTVWQTSLSCIPSPASAVCRLFNDGHSDWCEEVPHCINSFNLHFSND